MCLSGSKQSRVMLSNCSNANLVQVAAMHNAGQRVFVGELPLIKLSNVVFCSSKNLS